LISAETSTIDLNDEKEGGDKDEKKEEDKEEGAESKLSDAQAETLCKWLRSSLGPKKVKEVRFLHQHILTTSVILEVCSMLDS